MKKHITSKLRDVLFLTFDRVSISILFNLSHKVSTQFDKHANLKYKFGNRHFWAEGYYVSTVGLNEATIRKYKSDQEKHDIALDRLSVKEYEDPFKGSR